MSSALAGISLTTGPLGKSFTVFIIILKILKEFGASLVAENVSAAAHTTSFAWKVTKLKASFVDTVVPGFP